ncbi:uncharacterized protein LOC132921192 [Rhopalosiphum padi]|uniref:uncharacterized protein LOC132921192 n=1 Tax=Rhopalosiphum padi TaxID=40932 RepID=UPI00298EB26D|nr:uncharacterized protein LOC132921192 [Rhopalosiphum padi]
MKSSLYVALALFVTVVIADDSRSKKEAIYNPYGQITDANKYLATVHPAHVYNNNNNNYQQVPYNSYQPAAYSAYNQLQYYQQQPHQRVGGYPYNGDAATTGYNQYNNYPYSGGFQQYPYNVNQQYPYNVNQQYPYNVNQQYPYNVHQQYPYNVNQLQYGAYQQQYPYFGYQNAYGRQQIPFGYNNNNYNAYNFNQVVRQAPAYPSAGAQPVNPPVPHPFYHTQGTYYPTEINKPTPAAPAAPVEPPKKP